MPRPLSISPGQRFGRLTTIERATMTPYQRWRVRCDCGSEKVVHASNLAAQLTKSCGCLGRERTSERLTRHGHAQTRARRPSAEYTAWAGMIARCTRPGHISYKYYGGSGISVTDRWRNSFEAFLSDVGPKPSPAHSIDRIDVGGDYRPDNVRWATASEQQRNKRPRTSRGTA
jgi:hypothetical protein